MVFGGLIFIHFLMSLTVLPKSPKSTFKPQNIRHWRIFWFYFEFFESYYFSDFDYNYTSLYVCNVCIFYEMYLAKINILLESYR